MKKTLFFLSCFTIALASCGGSGDTSSSTSSQDTNPSVSAATPASPTAMLPGEKLVNKSDCLGCHNKSQKIVGPAYTDIAAKYPATDENIDKLAGKIISGGKGVWGEVEMTAHASLSKDDAKEMVKYILSLKP
jgi:cytochrome c